MPSETSSGGLATLDFVVVGIYLVAMIPTAQAGRLRPATKKSSVDFCDKAIRKPIAIDQRQLHPMQ